MRARENAISARFDCTKWSPVYEAEAAGRYDARLSAAECADRAGVCLGAPDVGGSFRGGRCFRRRGFMRRAGVSWYGLSVESALYRATAFE